jgi:uncharacterized repeat protein (TIGR01451 family)
MPPEQDSPLESLEKRLYGQHAQEDPRIAGAASVPAYSEKPLPVPHAWDAPEPPLAQPEKKRTSWTVFFLAGAAAFLVIAGAIAAYLVHQGTRAVSTDRVQVTIDAPVSVASGETVQLVMTVRNTNPAPLLNASLFATLPSGTRTADTPDAPLNQYTDALGTIAPGAQVTRTVTVKLFGTAGQSLTIPARVEFHTEGSNAVFVSNTQYALNITSSPISVDVQTIAQSPSGQPFTILVTVRSNANVPVENVAFAAQYPPGFTVGSTDPAPTATNFFSFGMLAPGDQRTIKISGTLVGQSADQRTFRFMAGSANPDGTNTLSSTYAEGTATVAITRPFLNVGLQLNQEGDDTVYASPGDTIGAFVTWQNSLKDVLANASIVVRVSGNGLDQSSIMGGTGFYRSQDSSVVFDRSNNPGLASLAAGDSGAGTFNFKVKSPAALAAVKNPTINLSVSIAGQQGAQGGAAQSLSSTVTRTIKIATAVLVTSSLDHRTGVDTGPVPPTADKETTYTVTLTAKNSVNSIGAAKETFQLPSYVRFTGVADSSVLYNPDTHTVTWNVGDIQPNSSASARFQVGVTPSSSQKGTSPAVINDQQFQAMDRFTGQQTFAAAAALTTELQGKRGSGTVK